MEKFKYVGSGAGVPGLPHEISDEEAERLGVVELLMAALENGNYEAVPQGDDISDQPSAVGDQPSTGDEAASTLKADIEKGEE